MDTVDLELLRRASVASEPFAHVVVPNFVPSSVLPRVMRELPSLAQGGSFPLSALRLGPAASGLMQALQGAALRDTIAALFQLDLNEAPTLVTLRGWSREKDGRPHCDSVAKRVTVLLYLNAAHDAWDQQQGCLRLLRGPGDLDNYHVEVPPVNGTLLVFPNGPTAWHGHKPFVGKRHVVQLNYMTNDQNARSELRRHRLSAFLKRIVA